MKRENLLFQTKEKLIEIQQQDKKSIMRLIIKLIKREIHQYHLIYFLLESMKEALNLKKD